MAMLGLFAVTVVVKVTGAPKNDGVPEEVTTLLVPTTLTVCVIGVALLAIKLAESGLYLALLVRSPSANLLMTRMAWPAAFTGTGFWLRPPMTKVTVPVGTAMLGLLASTVAVRVTGSPKTDGLPDEVTTVLVPT